MGVIEEILRLRDEASPALKKVSDEAASTTERMKALTMGAGAVAAGLLAAGAAAYTFTAQVAATRDAIGDTALRTGLLTETVHGLRQMIVVAGGDVGSLDAGMRGLTMRIVAAQQGTKQAEDAFKKYGIALKDDTGSLRDMDGIVRDVSKSLSSIADPTERAAASVELLGKQGGAMLEMFSSGDLEDYIRLTTAFGADVGPAAIAATDDWMSATADLALVWEGLKDNIGGDAMGPLTRGIQDFTTGLIAATTFAASFAQTIKSTFIAAWMQIRSSIEDDPTWVMFRTMLQTEAKGGSVWESVKAGVSAGAQAAQDRKSGIELGADLMQGVAEGLASAGRTAAAAAKGAAFDWMTLSGAAGTPAAGAGAGAGGGTTPSGKPGSPVWVDIDPDGDFAAELKGLSPETSGMAAEIAARAAADALRAQQMQAPMQGIDIATKIGTGDISGMLAMIPIPAVAAIAAGISGVQAVGQLGAGGVGDKLDAFREDLISGLRALPEILGEVIPDFVAQTIPALIQALIESAPAIVMASMEAQVKVIWTALKMSFSTLPEMLAEGVIKALHQWWDIAKEFIRDLFSGRLKEAFGDGEGGIGKTAVTGLRVGAAIATLGLSEVGIAIGKGVGKAVRGFADGGYVDRTQLALVHQGEYVVPPNGSPTGDLRGMGGGGINLHVSGVMATNVDDFMREVNRHLGSNGRGLAFGGVS
jgi:hypothetical protein